MSVVLAVGFALAGAAIPVLRLAGAVRKHLDALSHHPLFTAAEAGGADLQRLTQATGALGGRVSALRVAFDGIKTQCVNSPVAGIVADLVRIRRTFREFVEVLR